MKNLNAFCYFKASPEIIRLAVMIYVRFPLALRKVEDLLHELEIDFNQPVPQRLVRRHAGSGRLSLYLSTHAGAIHGQSMPVARVFLQELNEHATQHQFIYSHEWLPNDLVIWDNRATMHRATRYDSEEVRDLHRTTVSDSASTLQQPL